MGNWIPKHTYVRISLLLAVLFAAIIIPFTIVLSNQFSRYAFAEIDRYTQEKIVQTTDNTEFMLRKLKSYGINMYEDADIHGWLLGDSRDQFVLNAAVNRVSKLLSTEPFISKVYLVNMKHRDVIDTKLGIFRFQNFADQAILNKIKNNRPDFLTCFTHQANGTSYLAMIVPSIPSRQEMFGYIVLLMDKTLLQDYLLQRNQGADSRVIVLDENGELVLGTAETEEVRMVAAGIPREKYGTYQKEALGRSYSVNFRMMGAEKWVVYHISRMEDLTRNVSAFRNRIILTLLMILFLLCTVAFWSARRTYKPFASLAEQLQGSFVKQSQDQGSKRKPLQEYDVIKQGIELLMDSVNRSNTSIRNHKDLIKGEYLRQWLLQGSLHENIREYISYHSELLSKEVLNVAVIRIESYADFCEEYDFSSRKLLKFGMANIAGELITNRSWAVETVDLGSDHLVVLVGRNKGEEEHFIEVLEEVRVQIEKWMNIKVAVAASNDRHISDDLRYVYDHIYELTMLKFIWAKDKVFQEMDFEEYMTMVQPLPDDSILDELIQAVRTGQVERVSNLLDTLIQHMRSMTFAECKFQLTLSIYTLVKSFNKLASVQSFDGIENFLEKFNTLNEVRDWMNAELVVIASGYGQRKSSSRKEEVVMEIVEYVKNHLHDPMLTIEEIADHISLSAGYVRQLFKDVFDKTLSDYILDERIEKVRDLLETTDWPVAEIAERSGFQTRSHFFTAFKKVTGMTPNQYRLENKDKSVS